MITFDIPKQKSSIIKVLGVGGGGSNAVNFMFADEIEGVDFIICNTDSKALDQSPIPNKIQLGPHLTQGLGAGANPEVGKQATEESLEEIRRILEVNTKMAFITAGMGGGTGTGGAPIIAQVCREMGILTVGIVTTPFGFEGPRRLQQAEEGIRKLQPYVDTLLIISNDKLRMQYGNLKMKDAFAKADNVLATAAKCITDIINSHGHIIVDFADVCTVMKNGGVAILGNSAVEGEDRAQRAIEEALSSPLLNDNDITGAKWILININSAEGEFECTMDEMEIINNFLRMQAGEKTDVIMGMGYDKTLDKKLGITLIATGFDQREVFSYKEPAAIKPKQKEEKIVMTLGVEGEENKIFSQKEDETKHDETKPTLIEVASAPVTMPLIIQQTIEQYENNEETIFDIPTLQRKEEAKKEKEEKPSTHVIEDLHVLSLSEVPAKEEDAEPSVDEEKMVLNMDAPQEMEKFEYNEPVQEDKMPEAKAEKHPEITEEEKPRQSFLGSFLSKPRQIYAEPPAENNTQTETVETKPQPVAQKPNSEPGNEDLIELELVMREDQVDADDQLPPASAYAGFNDEEEEQKKRAAERIHKLRNLSFNMSTADNNTEFENVPAYVRRNMELYGGNKLTSVEDFYSKYAVKKDENTQTTHLPTLNSYLDGKKPD